MPVTHVSLFRLVAVRGTEKLTKVTGTWLLYGETGVTGVSALAADPKRGTELSIC